MLVYQRVVDGVFLVIDGEFFGKFANDWDNL
jgi:hypothetical protein